MFSHIQLHFTVLKVASPKLLLVLSAWLFMSSCESNDDSFLGVVYHDFTAFFNAYHNAKIEYERGLQAIRTTQDYSDRAKLLIFPTLENAASGKQFFERVIQKSSIVLQSHAASRYADNALLLLGKAYYHEKEFQPAERKFKEILSNYPNGDVADEATFWYGKTLASMQQFEEAREVLNSVILSDRSSPSVKADAHFVLAELAISDDDDNEAIKQIELGLPLQKEIELTSRAVYVLAKLYDRQGNYAKAAESYKAIFDLDPSYELLYVATLNYGIDLREQRLFGEAIKVFEQMLSDNKNYEKFGAIRYELAECYTMQERLGQAITLYLEIIRRNPRTESAAKSFYRLGRIRQEISLDFESAKALYDTARVQFPQGDIAERAKIASDRLGKILWLYETINTLDSTIRLGVVIPTIERKKADSLKVLQARDDSIRKATVSSGALIAKRKRYEYRRSFFIAMGFRDAFSEMATPSAQVVIQNKDRKKYPPAPDTLTLYVYKLELINRYAEASSFYHFSLPIPDSAEIWYRNALNLTDRFKPALPDSLLPSLMRYRETTLFSLSDIYRSLNNAPRQDSLLKIILREFPDGKYAARIRQFYGMPEREKSVSDQDLYNTALRAYFAGKGQDAVAQLNTLQLRFPATPLFPKALLLRALIYETQLTGKDSAISLYRYLASRFPNSPEAGSIQEKLSVINAADSSLKAPDPLPTISDTTKTAVPAAPKAAPLSEKGGTLPAVILAPSDTSTFGEVPQFFIPPEDTLSIPN